MAVSDQLIYPALRLAGRLSGPGRGASMDDTADALGILNRMLDSWSIDRLNVYTIVPATYTWTGGASSMTIGATGTIVAARPSRIDAATISQGGAQYPLRVVSDPAQWAAIAYRTQQGTPEALFFEGSVPDATLRMYPAPAIDSQLELWTWTAVSRFAAATDTVTLPPGYEDAIVNNLAVRIAAQFGLSLNPTVAAMAVESKAAIQSFNSPAPVAVPDSAVLGSSAYDVLVDRWI